MVSSWEFAVGGMVYSETGRGGTLMVCGVVKDVVEGRVVPWPPGVDC